MSTKWLHPHWTKFCIKSPCFSATSKKLDPLEKQIASLAAGLRNPKEQTWFCFLKLSTVSVCLHRLYFFVKAAFSGMKCEKILKWLNWYISMKLNLTTQMKTSNHSSSYRSRWLNRTAVLELWYLHYAWRPLRLMWTFLLDLTLRRREEREQHDSITSHDWSNTKVV